MKYEIIKRYAYAFQYDGDFKGSDGRKYVPGWAIKALDDREIVFDSYSSNEAPCELFINSENGRKHVNVGDYIVLIGGEITSYSPDEFYKIYKEVK
jgi:hypothetical protein